MRDRENILAVSRLAPDYMGFIFYEKTPRYVGEDFFIPDAFPESIQRVGVFVNETVERMMEKVADFRLDLVQLHGDESVEQCARLKDEGVKVIKVFSVDGEMDFRKTEKYRAVVDYFLFDTKGKLYGGNAKVFDWNVLSRYDQHVPFFLSGGITLDNVEEIKLLADMNLEAIDVNSGVEDRPAFKNVEKIRAIQAKINFKQTYK